MNHDGRQVDRQLGLTGELSLAELEVSDRRAIEPLFARERSQINGFPRENNENPFWMPCDFLLPVALICP
ncbi:MAG: hypothetical protein ACKO8U_10215, partial [Pirellula sp.]